VLNATQEITVREPAAQKALSDLSVRTRITRLDDPRYVLTPTPNDTSNGLLETLGLAQHRPLVCVTLRHLHDNMPEWVKVSHGYSQNAVDRANESLARALDTLATEAQLVVLPMHATRDEDMAAAAAIKARMRNPQTLCCNLPPLRALQLLSFVKRCDLVLASRLAAGMFSVSTATPVIGIAYEKRLIDLMSSVGLGTYVVPWLGADSDHLEAIAKRAWAARRHIRTLLLSSSRSVVESARSNAGVIARHLV
jgi:polysaccharide pyruvyl transferase WcaK-like protein